VRRAPRPKRTIYFPSPEHRARYYLMCS